MSDVRDEIPDTEHDLNLYLAYCKKQIHENKNHIKRLETRISWCREKAEKYGSLLKEDSIDN